MKPIALPMQDLTKTDSYSKSLLGLIQAQLKDFSESFYLDGLVLLTHVSGLTKTQILSDPSPELSPEQLDQLKHYLNLLQEGIPLPYIIGRWEFFKLPFLLTQDVLIPRPETEGLVERALTWLAENQFRRSCLEIGTGSGCIAVALAKNQPDLKITASDISVRALEIAQANARLNGVGSQVQFLEADLLEGITGEFDLLIANLPYIPTEKMTGLKVALSEPRQALDGGPNGLYLLKKLLDSAPAILKPGSLILFELDEDCGRAALELAERSFTHAEIDLEQDLSGLDRYLVIQT